MRRAGSGALRRGRGRVVPGVGGRVSASAPVGFGESSSSEDGSSDRNMQDVQATGSVTQRSVPTPLQSDSEGATKAGHMNLQVAVPTTGKHAQPPVTPRQDSLIKKRPRANKGRIFLPGAASDPFLEQLKQRKETRQLERETDVGEPSSLDNIDVSKKGSFDAGDPSTTNIFVGNLNPKTDENVLLTAFARFGPIASLKIMWPRTAEEYARGYNSGFISFMQRIDSEAAFQGMHETDVDGNVVRLEWGKAMPRVRNPLPLPAGQRYGGSAAKPLYGTDKAMDMGNEKLPRIIVQPPLDLATRREINKLAFSVAKVHSSEGGDASAEFVARVIGEEQLAGRSRFAFLWDGDDSNEDLIYYRWRVYSLAHNDTDVRWRTAPFAMVEGGPLWDPPPCVRPINNPPLAEAPEVQTAAGETKGVPEGSEVNTQEPLLLSIARRDESLPEEDRDELNRLLNEVTLQRATVALAMVFCIDRARCAGDIAVVLARRLLSLRERDASPAEALGIVYLITDVMHNSAYSGIVGASAHRERLGAVALVAFGGLGVWLRALPGRMVVHNTSARLEAVFTAWARAKYFPPDVIDSLKVSVFGALDKAQSVSMAVADFRSGRK